MRQDTVEPSAYGLNDSKLDCSKKEFVDDRRFPALKLHRMTHSCKTKKISSPVVHRRARQPLIIHTFPPKVIRTDPSDFMWVVQCLTGSSNTRSRCKKDRPQSAIDELLQVTGPTQTQSDDRQTDLADGSTEMQMCLENSAVSKGCSDEEETLSTELRLDSWSEIVDPEDASPRGPLPPFEYFYPSIATDECSLASCLSSSFSFSYPGAPQDTTDRFEPIYDSFLICPSPRDECFSSFNDLPFLSSYPDQKPSPVEGFIS